MGNIVSQTWPPKPKWNIDDIPSLTGKVSPFPRRVVDGKVTCVTGGYAGIGYETTKALLKKGAKVWIAGRSEEKASKAMEQLKRETGNESVHFLKLDLADMPSCAAAAKELISKEDRLDILFNNAGVNDMKGGQKTAQGYEIHWGVHVIGHFVFTKELLPLILSTAKSSRLTTRVIWTSSIEHNMAPKGIIDFDDPNLLKRNFHVRYGQSKAANILLATAMAEKFGDEGLLSFSLHPGSASTEVLRDMNPTIRGITKALFLYPAWMGALTQLYAGTCPDLRKEDNGAYFIPWARKGKARKGCQDKDLAIKLWEYLEREIQGKY